MCVHALLCSPNFCLPRARVTLRWTCPPPFSTCSFRKLFEWYSALPKHSACRGDGIFQGNERRAKKIVTRRATSVGAVGLFKETIIKVALIKRAVAQQGLLVRQELAAPLDRCHASIWYFSIGCYKSRRAQWTSLNEQPKFPLAAETEFRAANDRATPTFLPLLFFFHPRVYTPVPIDVLNGNCTVSSDNIDRCKRTWENNIHNG